MSNNSTTTHLVIPKAIPHDTGRVIERRLRELYQEVHALEQIVGVLRSELIKTQHRVERLEGKLVGISYTSEKTT